MSGATVGSACGDGACGTDREGVGLWLGVGLPKRDAKGLLIRDIGVLTAEIVGVEERGGSGGGLVGKCVRGGRGSAVVCAGREKLG